MAIEQGAVKFSQFNPQGLERTTFFQFFDAGINTYPTGSNQQPNDFLDLTNVLPATSGGFRLRWGLNTQYTQTGIFSAVRTWPYNVTQDASDPADTATEDLMISTDNKNFLTLKVTNTSAATPLVNTLSIAAFGGTLPTNFASSAAVGNVGAVVSRRWFYTCNGHDQPTKVNPGYTSQSTAWNWGIVAPAAYTGSIASAATSTITAFGGTGNGYTSPTVTISGGGGTGATCTAVVRSGSITNFLMTDPGSGYTSTPSVEITDSSGTGASAVAVYNEFGVIAAVLPSGQILLNAGRTYTYAWSNQEVSGHTSDIASGIQVGSTVESYTGNAATVLGPAVGIIGNVPAGVGFTQIFITINPVQPIDTQIDSLILMATADGGSLDQLYGVAIIPVTAPNPGQITYTDTLPDSYSDAVSSISGAAIAIDAVFARYFSAVTTAFFGGVTSSSTPLCTQSFNSLMFNPHPTIPADGTVILAGYPVNNGNQQSPFQNAALTGFGTFSNNIPCGVPGIPIGANPNDNFQMVLTGNFIVAAAGDITFTPYIDAAFLVGLGPSGSDTPTYVSGPQVFNGYTNTPFENYPCLVGIQNCLDWHTSMGEPFVINFPAAGTYPYEIGYATANHDEREMCLLANSSVIPPGSSSGAAYTGLTLLNANLWVDTDGYGNIFGIANNTPPPFGLLYPTLHQGRMFATDGKSLFFSKSLAEVTTSTGLITSRWEEAWPGTNSIPIGLNNEIILGLKSSGQTLHIGTAKSIYAMEGTDPTNFSIPSSLFQETGIVSNDTWNTIYAQGKPAGYLWISPDLKVIFSDFNTFQDVGQPIYTIISAWANSYNAYAKINSLTYGPYNLVFISFQVSGVGQEFLIFETTMQKWYRWTVPSNTSGPLSTFVYEQPETGYRALFMFQTTATQTYVACFDPQFVTDNTPSHSSAAIPYNIQTSWSSLGDGLAFKTINEMGVLTSDSAMTVTAYGARQQSDFASPTLLKSGTLSLNPLGTYKFYMAGVPTNGIFYSFKFNNSSPALSLGGEDVLTRFVVESFPMSRF